MGNPEVIRLAELVRQGERLLDHQLAIAAGQDEKSRHLITTSTAFLAAAAALVGFGALGLPLVHQIPFAASLAGAFACLGRAFTLFSSAYLGPVRKPMGYDIGWNPRQLRAASDAGDDLAAIHRSTLHALHRWFSHNEAIMERSGKKRRQGVHALLAAGAFLAEALIYVAVTNAP